MNWWLFPSFLSTSSEYLLESCAKPPLGGWGPRFFPVVTLCRCRCQPWQWGVVWLSHQAAAETWPSLLSFACSCCSQPCPSRLSKSLRTCCLTPCVNRSPAFWRWSQPSTQRWRGWTLSTRRRWIWVWLKKGRPGCAGVLVVSRPSRQILLPFLSSPRCFPHEFLYNLTPLLTLVVLGISAHPEHMGEVCYFLVKGHCGCAQKPTSFYGRHHANVSLCKQAFSTSLTYYHLFCFQQVNQIQKTVIEPLKK